MWAESASRERPHSSLLVPGWEDRTSRGRTILEAADTARRLATDVARLRQPHFVTYGEPAIVFHLNAHGYLAAPVFDFSFLAPGKRPIDQPAFLMALPNSEAEFQRLIAPYANRLTALVLYRESPSDLVLLDKYPPSDLVGIGGRPRESMPLYRILPR